MNIENLKSKIENNQLSQFFGIMVFSDTDFVCYQYYKEICKNLKLKPKVIDNVFEIPTQSIFGDIDNIFYVIKEDNIETLPASIKEKNCIIICRKLSKEIKKDFEEFIIDVPKLELWQVLDYIQSYEPKITKEEAEKLYYYCDKDLYYLTNELEKLKLCYKSFSDNDSVLKENFLFEVSDSILKKDVAKLSSLLMSSYVNDINSMSLYYLILANFRKYISVKFSKTATAESCNISSKQFWFFKNLVTEYSYEQLINIFSFLTSIDARVKKGNLDTKMLLDYLITKIISI